MLWDEKRQNQEIYQWYQDLIAIRKQYPCFTEGTTIRAEAVDESNLLLIEKKLQGQRGTLLVHMGEGQVPMEWLSAKELIGKTNLLTGESFTGNMRNYEAVVIVK
jgi:glycosidase